MGLSGSRFCVAGCGGLLHNGDGWWLGGFYIFLGSCSILKAEAWAVLEGMCLASDLGVELLEVDSDSLVLVNAVNGGWGCTIDILGIVNAILSLKSAFRG